MSNLLFLKSVKKRA